MQRPTHRFLALSVVHVTLLFFTLSGVSHRAVAQITTATVYVVVHDPSGATVPQSKATLLNNRTGASRTLDTGENGEFAFEFIPTGEYRLTVEAVE